MTRYVVVYCSIFLAACMYTPSAVPPQDEYVGNVPTDCPAADPQLEVENRSAEALEVFWVVGRRSAPGPGKRIRIGRFARGHTLLRVPENAATVILSGIDGHWDVALVKQGRTQYGLWLRCGVLE